MGIIAAAEAASSSKSGSSSFTFLILIVLVFIGFYFLMIRPQRRRQQQAQQQQKTVGPGARVRTTAGMYATVVEVDGDDVVLEVAPGIDVRYLRRAIMEVISSGEEPEEEGGFTEEEGGFTEPEAEDGTDTDVQDVDSDEHGVEDTHAEGSHDELTPSDKDKVV